ncbi:DUF6520 family protein [Flavobacterium soli]|uniref:DUF6520 family protein n=1 Tax=Flavobacterium soli TaxID=344881 RepID=UPI0012FA799E|nr:DUF6520 family protein [Flavobacterium soli]
MKTRFKKLMMPLAVAVLGIGGAFTTMSMAGNKVLDNRQAYQQISGTCVDQGFMCQTEFGDVCKSGDITLWGKPSLGATTCTVPLYHIEQ